jgi:hypothetical protein
MKLFGKLFGGRASPSSNLLVGTWKLMNSSPPLDPGTTLKILADGRLVYSIPQQDRIQSIHLTYVIEGDTLVTDQPSHPRKEISRFRLDGTDRLYLEGGGCQSSYRRID